MLARWHPDAAETDAGTEALADRLWIVLGAVVLVPVVTSTLVGGYLLRTGPDSVPPAGVVYGAAGLGLVLAAGLLWWRLDEAERAVAFPVRRPGRTELAWAIACVPVGVALFLGGEWIAGLLGFEPTPFYAYDPTDPATLVGVAVGALLVAPIVEELLFRGALIGALGGRGWSRFAAGTASVLVFAAYHVPGLGIAGAFAIAAWAVLPTVLRFRFDGLAGAWLLHLLNNAVAYLLVPTLL